MQQPKNIAEGQVGIATGDDPTNKSGRKKPFIFRNAGESGGINSERFRETHELLADSTTDD
ncbi:hypothetical protein A7X60_10625 [Stenotrophomonas maltophilia]|nr:hypothetical protein A7X60_10625 [Stenotrophomonas maltophilia]